MPDLDREERLKFYAGAVILTAVALVLSGLVLAAGWRLIVWVAP